MRKLLFTLLIIFAFFCVGFAADYGSNVLTGGTPSADSASGGTPASQAVDGNESTIWLGEYTAFPHWWKYDLGAAVTKTVRKLRIKLQTAGRLKDFTIKGSNNDSDWDDISTEQHANNTDWQEYTFANATAYRYYQIYVTSEWNSLLWCEIAETEMMEEVAVEHPTTSQLLLGGMWFKDGKLQYSDWARFKRGTSE